MQQKSLRQLARELGVSASYLSQVKNGKKRPSKDLLTKLDIEVLTKSVNQNSHVDFGASTYYNEPCAEVAQVVEQRTENPRVGGSTPPLGISAESFFATFCRHSPFESASGSKTHPDGAPRQRQRYTGGDAHAAC